MKSQIWRILFLLLFFNVFFESLNCCIYEIPNLANPLPASFLDTCSLLMLSLKCKALCVVINFLVLRSLHLSSWLVHFSCDAEYLTRSTDGCLFLWWDFYNKPLLLVIFLLFIGFLFLLSLSCLFVWWYPLLRFQSTFNFLSLPEIWCFSGVVVRIFLLLIFLSFLLSTWHILQHKIPSVYPDCIFLELVFLFLIFTNILISFIYIRRNNLSCNFANT